ncbi:MAG: YbjQ family protein, partial [Proteobacteria bacterium]|nr:YbjQ family protein [Pseudomonadota bacterium]
DDLLRAQLTLQPIVDIVEMDPTPIAEHASDLNVVGADPGDAAEPGIVFGLVVAAVVISVDYFKRFVAGLRMIFGGRVHTYESLLDRGRREALLRMQERAKELGANMIFNVRLETSSISKGARRSVGSVEVLAYGTAIIP